MKLQKLNIKCIDYLHPFIYNIYQGGGENLNLKCFESVDIQDYYAVPIGNLIQKGVWMHPHPP